MTQASSLHSLPAIDAGRPLTVATLADMGLTTDTWRNMAFQPVHVQR